jgi:hypothetical protein
MTDRFASRWREALGLDRRTAPEFYTSPSEVEAGPHADAIRFALTELRLAAVFCIEGVPTIGFLAGPDRSLSRIDELHRILWNQGLMSLLLVLREDELVAYSLVQKPLQRQGGQQDPRLIETLSLLSDALKLRELIDSTESGRFWFENGTFFNPDNRVDSVLLSNLLEAFREMRGDLGPDAAHALLMQTMFIAYLEDRKIIKEAVFRNASDGTCSSLAEMLESDSPTHFESLFAWLKGAFNGNLFNAPCAFETGEATPPKLATQHLRTLARFRHGREEMGTGQLRLWGYDFRYMSIGLISAVYDRFLKEEPERKSADGAFYTPMFLADVAINQLWDALSDDQRAKGLFCDPACGSGIFLVRLFQRLVAHHCRMMDKPHATWNELKSIARRLHGGDINSSAVRVAAFSLYIALLEQSNPPDLPALLKAGKLLPSLYGDTLLPAADFFAIADLPKFDGVVGNPPWNGRSGVTTAQIWAEAHDYPIPANEIAWGFIWKALKVVKPDGLIAFLLPAMAVLHNTSQGAQDARRRLLRDTRVHRIINLSDLCFQLFDKAKRPTAFVLFAPAGNDRHPYRFEYWVPKADLNLRLKRMITLSRADRLRLRSDLVGKDPTLFKRRLWTRGPEETLLQYLKTVPPLSTLIKEYKEVGKAKLDRKADWVIGQGFQPAQQRRLGGDNNFITANEVTRYPYLPAEVFRPIVLPRIHGSSWNTSTVRRGGFAEGFVGPHILIPQGVERSSGRVRAAYCEQNLVFQHSIQAVAFPEAEKRRAKVLTAVLNSSLAAWVYFHDTANLGADRAKVHQAELLKLPFDAPENMPDPARAEIAEQKIVQLIDREAAKANELLSVESSALREIDQLVFDYYGLDAHDIALIDDTLRYVIPAVQPGRAAGLQKIWASSTYEQRADYAAMLCQALATSFWQPLQASLAAKSGDIAILKLTINVTSDQYTEDNAPDVGQFLRSLEARLPARLPGNVQVVPDLRFVIGRDMYLVKPIQLRHWLRSTALADAEQIAAEFAAAIARHGRTGGDHAGR